MVIGLLLVQPCVSVDLEPEVLHATVPPGMCTALGVGKNTTADGSTMCTQSADCGMCDFTIHIVPAEDHGIFVGSGGDLNRQGL